MPNDPRFRTSVPLTPDHKAVGGARAHSLDSPDAHSYLWAGRILHVDTEQMVCSVRLETGNGERHDVPIPAFGGGGPRSWSGTVLEPGSKVILGWKKYDHRSFVPYIVAVVTVGTPSARDFEPFSTADPADVASVLAIMPELADDPHVNLEVLRLKARKGYPGDFIASASSGADLILDRDFYATNRAGNEIRLRDADQTYVMQTSNEFVSNAAGYYRRGLIRRDAFNILLDVIASGFDRAGTQTFDDYLAANPFLIQELKDADGNSVTDSAGNPVAVRTVIGEKGVPVGSPAYDQLLAEGLVNADGTKSFPDDPNDPFYPYVVHPDGQRSSYVVTGEHSQSFSEAFDCYVEDRREIRHTSDGTMAVTADGDGVQIDPAGFPQLFIEDVVGTVVGNDPYTVPGRANYKRILSMRVFDSPDEAAPSTGPKFDPIDTVMSQSDADTKALCRLFRVQSPSNSNQYAFGISKEGRVFLHVPASTGTHPDESGKSVDANIVGAMKVLLGMDQSRTSMDFSCQGGVKINLGAFMSEDPNDPNPISVDLTMPGRIRTNYTGVAGRETVLAGNDMRTMTGTAMDLVQGSSVENVGGTKAIEANSITLNAGAGGCKMKFAGNVNQTCLGIVTELYSLPRITAFALGDLKTVVAGLDVYTILAGAMTRTVVAGAMADTVATGNYVLSAAAGNIAMTVGAGNLAATVGAGNLALTCGAGTVTVTSGPVGSFIAGGVANILAPLVKVGPTGVGFAVAGIPGPPGPHLDFLTGLPLFGVPTVLIG